ncbi:hypothetical protein BGX23_012697 [Mortierella sp. AD031]|nr:hypothetical protein BGX23_012697 [Mortierella sp. AD031]
MPQLDPTKLETYYSAFPIDTSTVGMPWAETASSTDEAQGGSSVASRHRLRHLSTLRRLRTVVFLDMNHMNQDMKREDIDWMAANLPVLRRLEGGFSDGEEFDEELKQVVNKHGIHRSPGGTHRHHSRLALQERSTPTSRHLLPPQSVSILITHVWKEVVIRSDFPHYYNYGRLWGRVKKTTVKLLVEAGRLEKHAPLVLVLRLHGPLPPEYYPIAFPRLHTLWLHYDSEYHSPEEEGAEFDDALAAEQDINNTNLILHNPTIQYLHLHLHLDRLRLSKDFWVAIFTTLDNPKLLNINHARCLTGDTFDSFWKVCARFEKISIKHLDLGHSELLFQRSFPRLRRLSLGWPDKDRKGFHSIPHLAWLKQCSNLTQLHWELFLVRFPIDEWVKAFEEETWPHLEDLSLEELEEDDKESARSFLLPPLRRLRQRSKEFGENDVELTTMFSRLPPLRRFRLRSYEFGQLAFSTLRERLFDNLKVLDMARNYKFTSRMALDVMEECVHLEDFRMFCVDADELRDPVRPWVCLGLERLKGLWAVAAEGSNTLVFEALSRLTCLEYLDFGLDKGILMDILYIYPQGSTFLRWSVDEGLQHLATMKRLAMVLFLNTTQDMDVEDIEWTAENLPALKQLRGTFSDDDDTNEQLKQIAKEIEQDPEQLANNINLIQLNPTIKELEVTMSDIHLWGEFWKTIDTTLDKPKRLCVERVYFKGDALDSFWKACAQFEEVSCRGYYPEDSELLAQLSFSQTPSQSANGSERLRRRHGQIWRTSRWKAYPGTLRSSTSFSLGYHLSVASD